MKRLVCMAIPLALCLFAQTSRDAYRNAYKVWREADPALERETGKGGAGFDQRTQVVAAAAARYGAERSAFLQQLITETGKTLSRLEIPAPAQAPVASPQIQVQYVAANSAAVNRVAGAVAKDPDPGMRPLRLALERERAALTSVSQALAQRQRAADAARDATAAAEQARLKALEQFRQMANGLKQTLEQTGHETTAWAEYYRQLGASAAAQASPPPPVVAASKPTVPANPGPPAAEVAPPRPVALSITPVPLVRYTGIWTYPSVNGVYHGLQPEFVDLTVNDEDGRAQGTLSARFKLPAGSSDDPAVLFSFAGDFKNSYTQRFDLRTNAGAKGILELIPGPAFNLLEVNFRIEPRPGKISQGNFLLLKQ